MKKSKIVMLAIAIVFIVLGFRTMNTAPKTAEKLSKAVYVTDGKILAGNEGKLVIVTGKIETSLPLVDKITGVKLPAFTAERIVEAYETNIDDDDEEPTLAWTMQEKALDVNSPSLTTSMLYAPSKVGEYSLDAKMMEGIEPWRVYDMFRPEELAGGFSLRYDTDMNYLTYMPYDEQDSFDSLFEDSSQEGLLRISYKIYPYDSEEVFTFVGLQKDGMLVPDRSLEIKAASTGLKTAEDFMETVQKGAKTSAIISWGFAALFLLFALSPSKKKA